MADRDNPGAGDTLLTAAAAGILAVAAARATGGDSRAPARPGPPTSGSRSALAGPRFAADTPDVLAAAASGPGLKGKVERIQMGSNPLAFVVGVVKKFGDDQAGKLAALVAYYGFFSLFPAMLAMVTVLGFVLDGHEDLRDDIRDSALSQFPVIGDSIGSALDKPLTGSTIALIIGLAGALWAGLGAMQAAQDAMNNIWDVPRAEYPSFLVKRLRSLGALAILGVLFGATAVVPAITGAFTSGALAIVLLFVASAAVDAFAFLLAFHVLTVAKVHWRQLVPGAVVGGIAYLVLQSLGTLYVQRVLKGAENTYGTFAVVIGLLSWMYLLAQMSMFAAEINVVRARHLWPRRLFAPAADREVPQPVAGHEDVPAHGTQASAAAATT